MCIETCQSYSSCYCRTTCHEICALHIEHTRMQIDNDPCPDHVRISTETGRGCRPRSVCTAKIETCYTFENHGARLFEKDREKARVLKERTERRKAEEERARRSAQRQERDLAAFEEKRRKKLRVKEEKAEEAEREVGLNQIQLWGGAVRERVESDQEMEV